MTPQQLNLFNCLYLAILVVVAFCTRTTALRVAGALAGGAAVGVMSMGIIALGEEVGWWRMTISWEPYFMTLMLIDFSLCIHFPDHVADCAASVGAGWGVVVFVMAVFGPLRDYQYMARFPEWGAYASGFAPILAVSTTYVMLVVVGHGVMRLIAGPAQEDRLARRPWEAEDPHSRS